ncbi:PREDICTED: chymotrypsin inhibitor-like [Dufourea novaeangliae]|uniref:chymotrypsin inhibitor-like n=1 Tax=Dufourea novaeangliae TaxID=178035 RepID=UPI0007675AFC|nr:PREDICTED: chymotrypsin inhibitor-like [Dufourea novaeangliae]
MSRVAILLLFVAVAFISLSNADHECGKNEVYSECGSNCEPKCGEKEPTYCPQVCLEGRCQCKAGYKRNAEGACVWPNKCPSP